MQEKNICHLKNRPVFRRAERCVKIIECKYALILCRLYVWNAAAGSRKKERKNEEINTGADMVGEQAEHAASLCNRKLTTSAGLWY